MGRYTWFWGFEVMNSNPERSNPVSGSHPIDARGYGIFITAAGTKIINVVVHDTGQGISCGPAAKDVELYGNIIYFNGWTAPDRGHGHGIYVQNYEGGSKLIKHNVLFNGFSYNLHAYGSSAAGFVNSTVEENVWFLGVTLIGGLSGFSISGTQVTGNYSWGSPTAVGYFSKNCNAMTVSGNYFVNVGHSSAYTPPTDPLCRAAFSLTSNTIVGDLDGFKAADYPNNTYYSKTSPPTQDKLTVLSNAYEAGRATIVVYNWDGSATQAVDLTGVVAPGAAYEIRNVQNFYGPPVVSGTYAGGTVTLPMTGLTPATPIGYEARPPTGPAFNVFVVLPAGGTFVENRVLPVVLDVSVQKGAHFSTEVTLANRGVTPASLSLTYTASPQFPADGGTVTDDLPPGRQLVIPDAISFLRGRGLPLGSGNQGGSLSVTFAGLSSPEASYAAARITFPSGPGRASTTLPSVRPNDGFDSRAMVFGLRESERERSNLALVNLASSGSLTLDVTVFSGAGDGMTATLAPVTLGPGEWIQVRSPLAAAGFDNGFVAVERKSGTGRFFAYGVVNDNLTNDGAFIAPVHYETSPEEQVLPVIVESGTFDSDLVLANPEDQPVTASLSYVESLASPADGEPFRTDVALGPFEQRLIPAAIDFLRQRGLNIGPRGGASHAGAVGVLFSRDGNPAQGYVGALTASPAPHGGRYGLFYGGVPVSRAAAGDAWVYGLRQDETSRSNLAIASAGDAGEPVTCRLEVYDGDTGHLAGQLDPFVVPSRGWIQFQRVLAGFGVSNGYVRLVGSTGADRLVVYGVVIDGATASSDRTNDGSFVPSPPN